MTHRPGTRDPERHWSSPSLWNQCGTTRVETIDLRSLRPVTEWGSDIYCPTNDPNQE